MFFLSTLEASAGMPCSLLSGQPGESWLGVSSAVHHTSGELPEIALWVLTTEDA